MKKTISLLLVFMLVLSATVAFAACKKGGETEKPVDNTDEVTEDQTDENAASDLAYIIEKGTLVVGITDYAPMDYRDDNGEWTGFDAEYAKAVAEKIGVEVEFVEIDWENKANELNSKAIDCIWNGMTILDDLKASMDITDAYAMNAQVVVMKADKVQDYLDDVGSMAELTFAVEAGSAGAKVAEDNGFNVTEVAAQSDALTEVESGASDACIIDITMANAMTGEGTSYADLAKGMSLNEEEYGVGVRIGSDLCAKINELTDELVADGTLAALAEKYELTLAD